VPTKVLLAAPRGYCAGVERAVEAVERALETHGRPVYVRKQIVHNAHVVRDLEAKGAVFVEEETEVPEGAVVVLSRTASRRRSTRTPNAGGSPSWTRRARSSRRCIWRPGGSPPTDGRSC
jgi:hypothetical protein